MGKMVKYLSALFVVVLFTAVAWGAEPEDFFKAGMKAANAGDYERAAAAFRRAVSLKDDYTEAHYNLGVALAGLKRFEEAASAYKRTTELKPSYAPAWNGLGVACRELERFDEAEAAFRKAAETDGKYWAPHYNLGDLYAALGKTTGQSNPSSTP